MISYVKQRKWNQTLPWKWVLFFILYNLKVLSKILKIRKNETVILHVFSIHTKLSLLFWGKGGNKVVKWLEFVSMLEVLGLTLSPEIVYPNILLLSSVTLWK